MHVERCWGHCLHNAHKYCCMQRYVCLYTEGVCIISFAIRQFQMNPTKPSFYSFLAELEHTTGSRFSSCEPPKQGENQKTRRIPKAAYKHFVHFSSLPRARLFDPSMGRTAKT